MNFATRWAREAILGRNLKNYNQSEIDRMQRAVAAKQLNLPPEDFATPFPASNTTINNKPGLGWLAPLAAAILGASGLGAAALLSPKTPASAPVRPPAIVQPATGYDSSVDVKVIPPENP